MLFRGINHLTILGTGCLVLAMLGASNVGAVPFSGTQGQALSQGVDPLIIKVQARVLRPAMRKALRDGGYTQIIIKKQSRKRSNVGACKGEYRYTVKIRNDGRILKKVRHGKCVNQPRVNPRNAGGVSKPAIVAPQQVRRSLRNSGYSNITIINRNPPGYTVKACKNGKR